MSLSDKWLPPVRRPSFFQKSQIPLLQTNRRHESDCEILKVSGGYFALNCDTLVDEIETGMYITPKQIGRMAVIGALSDIAVAGAIPFGIMSSVTWATHWSGASRKNLAHAIQDEAFRCHAYVMGGDQSEASQGSVTITAFGFSKSPPITRLGARRGDCLILLGQVGNGPALSQATYHRKSSAKLRNSFYPQLFFTDIQKIKRFVTAGIDNSDGILASVRILEALNTLKCEVLLDRLPISSVAKANGLNALDVFNYPMGDYNPIYVVPQKNLEKVLRLCKKARWIGIFT